MGGNSSQPDHNHKPIGNRLPQRRQHRMVHNNERAAFRGLLRKSNARDPRQRRHIREPDTPHSKRRQQRLPPDAEPCRQQHTPPENRQFRPINTRNIRHLGHRSRPDQSRARHNRNLTHSNNQRNTTDPGHRRHRGGSGPTRSSLGRRNLKRRKSHTLRGHLMTTHRYGCRCPSCSEGITRSSKPGQPPYVPIPRETDPQPPRPPATKRKPPPRKR